MTTKSLAIAGVVEVARGRGIQVEVGERGLVDQLPRQILEILRVVVLLAAVHLGLLVDEVGGQLVVVAVVDALRRLRLSRRRRRQHGRARRYGHLRVDIGGRTLVVVELVVIVAVVVVVVVGFFVVVENAGHLHVAHEIVLDCVHK